MANVQFNNYSPPARTRKESYEIIISLFFDGTKNNKNNSDARVADSAAYQQHGADDDESSYQNDWSNVARLWDASSDKANRIYIEGIGTTDNASDSQTGYAFGSGFTGIRFKVRKGCDQAAERINTLYSANKGKQLTSIVFNVYGFSRGAAAARNFVYEISRPAYQGKKMESADGSMHAFYDTDHMPAREEMPSGGHLGYALAIKGIVLDARLFQVNFLGIFDTVSSYSPTPPIPRFSNDIGELNLNSLGKAQHVVHFTANDEIRENFSLTRSPKGIEKNLPGVHSDVGGSYLSGPEIKEEIETSWTMNTRLHPFRDRLIEEGWYKAGDLTITGGIAYWALRGEKKMVYKEYSFIPLHFMADFSVDYKSPINATLATTKYAIDAHPTLLSAKENLKKYVRNGEAYPYTGNNLLTELKALRYSYFHRSARREGIGMDPNSDWKRRELKP